MAAVRRLIRALPPLALIAVIATLPVWGPAPAAEAHTPSPTFATSSRYIVCALRIAKTTTQNGNPTNTWISCRSSDEMKVPTGGGVTLDLLLSGCCGSNNFINYAQISTTGVTQFQRTGSITCGSCDWSHASLSNFTSAGTNPGTPCDSVGGNWVLHDNSCRRTPNVVTVLEVGTGYPPYPNDEGVIPPVAPDPEPFCDVQLASGNGTWAARYTSGTTNPAVGYSDAYGWAWGEGGTSSGADVTRNYSGAQNAGGPWTGTLTVTRTVTDTNAWSAPADPTRTATTSFDFYTTTQPTCDPEGATPPTTPPGEDEQPDDCSFFDVVCWLRRLFIPADGGLDGAIEESVNELQDNWPYGPLLWAAESTFDVMDEFKTGLDGEGSTAEPNGTPYVLECDDPEDRGGKLRLPNYPNPGSSDPGDDIDSLELVNLCENAFGNFDRIIRGITTVLITIGGLNTAGKMAFAVMGGEMPWVLGANREDD